jgi:hypothetical protein
LHLLFPALLLLAGPVALGHGQPVRQRAGTPIDLGECTSPRGTVLAREQGGKSWTALGPGKSIRSGDTLVALPGERGELALKKGAARLSLVGLLPEVSLSDALDSSVRLYRPTGADVDVLVERGRVQLSRRGAKGDVKVHVRVGKQFWDVTLQEPGTEIVLEVVHNWPRGVRLPVKAGADLQRATYFTLVLVKGSGQLAVDGEEFGLRPVSIYNWSSGAGGFGPRSLSSLPAFLKQRKEPLPGAAALEAGIARLRELYAKEESEPLRQAIQAKDAGTRRAGVFAAASLADLGRLLDASADVKHADVRAAAVIGLRYWLAQSAGHPAELNQALLNRRTPKGQAATILYLLHTYSEDERRRPETYEALIDYLQHGNVMIRELASWQLYRLVPQGHKIHYDAAAPAEELARAHREWRQLIPVGELPPAPKEQP